MPEECVAEIREALARFLFATRIGKDDKTSGTYIIGNGSIGYMGMAAYIQAIREEKSAADV